MHNVLSMTMVDSLEQITHVSCSLRLCEGLILLLCDLIEELGAGHIFHHQVDILLIVVRLVILHDIGMVKGMQNAHFLHDAIYIIAQLYLIEDFYSNLKVLIVLIRREEDPAECANSKHLCLRINVIVLF